MTGPEDSGRDLGPEQALRGGEGRSAQSPPPVPRDPREPLVLGRVRGQGRPHAVWLLPRGCPRSSPRVHAAAPLAWVEVDAPALPAWRRPWAAALSRPWFSVLLQPLSQPESPAPGPPAHMDLEPPPQPLFGTPASQPKKEPPGYEEALSQQPRPQVEGDHGLTAGVATVPRSHGRRGWPEPAFWVREALERGCQGGREGVLWEPGCSPLGPECWLRAGRVCAPSQAGASCCRSSSFNDLAPQENGSSSQQMDDLFDILIQSGGKVQAPCCLPLPSCLPRCL